jgi:hypothetical protein
MIKTINYIIDIIFFTAMGNHVRALHPIVCFFVVCSNNNIFFTGKDIIVVLNP